MNERYSMETLKRTVALIQERFHTSITHSERLAAAALNGIDAHGLDPDDWATVVATVDVVVRAWISGNGTNSVGIADIWMDFSFQSRWKEELVCICRLGKLVLEMPMGVPSVYIPSEQAWQDSAPAWAVPYWQALHLQLAKWCADQGIPLHVDKSASVFVA